MAEAFEIGKFVFRDGPLAAFPVIARVFAVKLPAVVKYERFKTDFRRGFKLLFKQLLLRLLVKRVPR